VRVNNSSGTVFSNFSQVIITDAPPAPIARFGDAFALSASASSSLDESFACSSGGVEREHCQGRKEQWLFFIACGFADGFRGMRGP
jgi:hypothetical protein